MGKQKYSQEIKELVIKLRLEGKTIPEIEAVTGMGRPSQQKLYRENGIKLNEEQYKIATNGARWKNHEPIKGGMKFCPGCELNKSIDNFHTSKNTKTGLTSKCKSCASLDYKENCDKKKAMVRKYREENLDQVRDTYRIYYAENKQKFLDRAEKWHKENPDKVKRSVNEYGKRTQKAKNARTAAYRAAKIQATPPWLTQEHYAQMEEIYKNCPEGYHVDHIMPLRGVNSSGLHVPWNLQYLPALENMSKGNKVPTDK